MAMNVNRVKWDQLTHAYGAAVDVPKLLLDLASSDAGAQRTAIYEFYGNIWHQETVYEATSYVVPFLIEILKTASVDTRADILMLLADIASGRSYMEVHAPTKESPSFEELGGATKLAKELLWVTAARNAVAEGIESYGELLQNPDRRLQLLAAYL